MTLLSQKIRAFRVAESLSQTELAGLADVTRNYISLIESGKKIPSTKTLLLLARALKISAGVLLDDEPDILKLRQSISSEKIRAVVTNIQKIQNRQDEP